MKKNKQTDDSEENPFWLDHVDRRARTHNWRRPSWREQRREETMKEWFGPELARGEIRNRQRAATPLKQTLDNLMQELGKGRQILLEQIRDNWSSLVGVDIARQTQPLRLYRKSLEVEVNHAMWLYELQTRMKPSLTKILMEFSQNQVETLRFVPAGRRRAGQNLG